MNLRSMCLLFFSLTLLCGFYPSSASACSCAMMGHSPFLTQERLPANAKGVLYYNPFNGGMGNSTQTSFVVGKLPEELTESFFEVYDETLKASVKFKIKKLDLSYLTPSQESNRYFRLIDEESENCLWQGGDSKACRALSKIRYETDWIEQLNKQGKLTEVTKDVKQRYGLFRIEPLEGFKAGHTYSFSTKEKPSKAVSYYAPGLPAGTLRIIIDETALNFPLKESATINFNKGMKLSLVSIPSGGGCSDNVLADVQEVSYELPKALLPYSKSVLHFTTLEHNSETKKNTVETKVWNYRSSLCSSVQWGKTEKGFAQDLLYSPCKQDQYFQRGIMHGINYSLKAYYGLLEVQDKLDGIPVSTIRFPKRAPAECSTAKLLSDAKESKDTDALKKQICQFSGSFGGDFSKDPDKLITSVLRLTTHDDVAIRRCAVKSLSHLGYQTQRVKDSTVFETIANTVFPALIKILSNEKDLAVRKSAITALKHLAQIGQRQSSAIQEAAIQHAPSIATLLKDDDKDIRVAAAEMLAAPGNAIENIAPLLIEALKDSSKPNYRLPTALVQIAPTHDQTIPALIKALESKDSIVRSTAAQGLGKVGVFDDRVVPALIKAVKEDNSDAISALGLLGSQSEAATPLLLKLSKESKWAHIRTAALSALSKIGNSENEVIKSILSNMNNPIGEYSRQQAIETLGTLGTKAAHTIPDLLNVLERKPTDYEIYTLLKTLEQLGARYVDVKNALIPHVTHQRAPVKERIADYLLKLNSIDSDVLVKLLNDDGDGMIYRACNAIKADTVSQIANQEEIVNALAAIIEDETRDMNTVSCAIRAVEHFPLKNAALCSALTSVKSRLINPYELNKSIELKKKICG